MKVLNVKETVTVTIQTTDNEYLFVDPSVMVWPRSRRNGKRVFDFTFSNPINPDMTIAVICAARCSTNDGDLDTVDSIRYIRFDNDTKTIVSDIKRDDVKILTDLLQHERCIYNMSGDLYTYYE